MNNFFIRYFVLGLMLLLCVFPVAIVQANETDLGKVTCQQFLDGNKNSKKMMLTWIDGYMSAVTKNTVMSEDWMVRLATHMTGYCTENPAKVIMDAINVMPHEDKE